MIRRNASHQRLIVVVLTLTTNQFCRRRNVRRPCFACNNVTQTKIPTKDVPLCPPCKKVSKGLHVTEWREHPRGQSDFSGQSIATLRKTLSVLANFCSMKDIDTTWLETGRALLTKEAKVSLIVALCFRRCRVSSSHAPSPSMLQSSFCGSC